MRFQTINLLAATAQWLTAYAAQPMPDYHGCIDKPNGPYMHPSDCTHYVMCSNDLAYDIECEDCNEEDNPGRCRDGRTVFDAELGQCNWADVTPCRIDESDGQGDEGEIEL